MKKPDEGGASPTGEAKDTETKSTAQNVDSQVQERRRRFAKAMARSAFGRFYWDERLEAEMHRAMNGAKRPKT